MAGALVGGALLSAFLQVACDRLASSKVLDFFRARKLDEMLLRKLEDMLLSIDALADDAELKQFSDPRVKAWLVAVRDAVFDAEDLLGEIDYEVSKCQLQSESESQTLTGKVPNFFNTTFSPFNKKIESEMKQILKKLEYLASQKDALGLRNATCASVGSVSKKQTTSLVVQSDIYGRDEDKEVIFNWLTSETGNHKQLSILSVVGMGGVGKTTLAQHVYNDPRMEEADFDIKAWVCVSDEFDVLRLTKAILETITQSKYDSGDLEMVRGRLKEELAGKRFLLVLDDVWNERQEDWEAFQIPLNYGAPGSRILVTTRSEKVAYIMRSNEVHLLKQVEDDHCWQIFAKHAFQHDHLPLNAELKGIATEIVKKCKGLPLALKLIGSLLRTKSSISEWEDVLKSELWDLPIGDNEIIPALLLSYHPLPSHLKRCFSYCALFPKDYVFNKEDLIQLWMAQNFLEDPQQSRSPEEVGEQYFDDLLSKSFFQQSSEDGTRFVMHDLLNDLANYVCGDICFRLGVGKARRVPKTSCHFSIASNYKEYFDVFESLHDAKRLRTFFPATGRVSFFPEPWECRISVHDLFPTFKFLHVLSLSHCSDLREVPDSLGELKHLRSLDLSRTAIEKLPDSTCLLYNLQILKLVGCWRLAELPMKLYKLTNLRCLEFRDTRVRRMPMHFGKLKNLQVLDVFYAGKSSEFSIQQLGGHNLHGKLSIKELQNIEDPSDALAVDLINKTHLEELELEWNREHILVDDPRKEEEVLENLQPSKHLQYLSILNYGGTQFPSWFSNNALSYVVSLRLKDCKYCVCLPCLGLLPSLKELTITGFDGIVSVGAEFYGSISSPFPSLERLYFYNMKEWEEWECNVTFPRLQYLEILECPKLKGQSEQLLLVKKLYSSGPSLEASSLYSSGPSLEALSLKTEGALVGGALVSAFLQAAVDRLASRQLVDFFCQRQLDEALLNKLKLKLLSIDALADDTEQKQLTDPRVREWLFAVKDVVFDAEDLLTEINYELTKCQVEAESQSHTFTYKESNFFNSTFNSFNRKIVSGMKEVHEKLEYLASQKVDLDLKEATYSGVGSGSKMSQKLPSTSLVVESVMYGRDYDKEIIFNWLASKTDNHNQLSILSVVGMGGSGKTTLAQHVYNDSRMEAAKFDIKAWVCVSDDFDVLTVTRTILEAITNSKDDSRNLEMVHGRLKQKLSGKKFLLVLDDVWNESREKWELVQTPLNYGAPGSRILVTTRNESVASIMQSNEVHHLQQLQEDQSWIVFAKHAFEDDHPPLDSETKDIATKIVEKCKGLPLALKSIGCLLRTKSSVTEWKGVLLSNIWNLKKGNIQIIPALFLSYCHLPSYLKRCFAFCALFPKDFDFDKEELILLWIAEGFLQCPQQSQSPLEVGEIYFEYLLSMSFFQQSGRYQRYFNMHGLVNDLAKYVCGDICFQLGVDIAKSMPKTTRHFSFAMADPKYWDGSGSLTDAKRLRTFIPTTTRISGDLLIPVNELFSKFGYLSVLSLSGYLDLEQLPESVSELKYLCSLDLSHTKIKRLPDSTCLLYNLQVLKLNSCMSLEELPSNLHKLTNLCCLEFRETKVKEMPVPLEKLKNLLVLSKFWVGKSSESCNTQQLGRLNLHGELSIEELQNVVNPMDALAVDLKSKTHLGKLELRWNWNHIPDDSRKENEILENLQPPKHLKYLSIWNYGGTEFPSWLSNNSLSNVVSLDMMDCKYCICLPCLGLLPSLKKLRVLGFDGIVIVGAEFHGSSSSPFPSLEELYFEFMEKWEEWECNVTFPRLQYLSIKQCPKLKGLPEQLLHVKELYISGPSLEASSLETDSFLPLSLQIWNCPDLNIPMRLCCDFLQELDICNSCDFLLTFPLDFFPRLCSLKLESCRNLRMISQERTHTHLKELSIMMCHQFESFPSEGLSAPKLETFSIKGLETLKSLPKRMHILLPSLTRLPIIDCPEVEMFSEVRLCCDFLQELVINDSCDSLMTFPLDFFPKLYSLQLINCGNLQMISQERTHTHLKELSISGCHQLQSMPKGMHILLPSLTDLCIHDCPKVEMFSEGGLPSNLRSVELSSYKLITSGNLGVNTCLESMCIGGADDVECFPEEGFLPLSLTSLGICNCPNLKKLDYKGLCQLSSLKLLSLNFCPNLECLPEEGLPRSITTIEIICCGLLKQRCQKPEGQDWRKIAHIQDLTIW